MTSYRLGGVLLAAAALLSTVPAGTATAEHAPRSTLTLTLDATRGADSAVRLQCQPSGGSHPRSDHACGDLTAARGDFDHLPGTPETIACTMEHRPVTATARGSWRGERVFWQHQYPNPCTLLHETGVVFDF